VRAPAAEALGTLLLVVVGCGAVMADASGGGLGTVGISLAFGGVVTVLGYTLGPTSGAHLNPAVTLALAARGRFPHRRVLPYVAAQALGATLGAAILLLALGPVAGLGATRLLRGTTPAGGFLLEGAATFLLVAAVLAATRAPRGWGPALPGLAVGLGALVVGPLTMAGMNPARSLGPALVAGSGLDLWWLYTLAPLAGALLAVASAAALAPPAPMPAPMPASMPAPPVDAAPEEHQA
jgi:MIP family channel proteins